MQPADPVFKGVSLFQSVLLGLKAKCLTPNAELQR
jgi:hypothetical protein